MATKTIAKTVAKKTVTKKTVSKKAPVAAANRKVVGRPSGGNSEIFTTEVVEVPKNSVLLFINSESHGVTDTTDQTVGGFVVRQAQEAGIKSFSVYADGEKLNETHANRSMRTFTKVELISKDDRGVR